jgi:DNA polymerase-3 subunit alpha
LTQLGRTVSDENKRSLCTEFWFKDPQTMEEQFAYCPEALANTLEVAGRCDVGFKFVDDKGRPIYYLPNFQIPPGESAKTVEEFLDVESKRGLDWRFQQPSFQKTVNSPEWPELEKRYRDRLVDEIGMIQKTGFSGYFLIVSDFIRWAKSQGIPVGPGRGSGAGSIVAWALNIIDIDPLPYNLLFERFLNPDRKDMPDVDTDFCVEKRDQVINYIKEKYGKEKVGQIITFGSLAAKAALKDVARVLNISFAESNEISKAFPAKLGISIAEAVDVSNDLKQLKEKNEINKKLFYIAEKLEGNYRQPGRHAAGVVISPYPLEEIVPLSTVAEKGKNGRSSG